LITMVKRLPLLTLAGLSACAPVVVPIPVPLPQPKPQIELIGRDPQTVIDLLGSPTLDRTEGPARHLQFARTSCVLHVFFYPDKRTAQPTATHVEAQTPTGQTLDTRSCIDSLMKPPAAATS